MSSQALMLLEHDLMSGVQILSQDFQELASNIYEDVSKTTLIVRDFSSAYLIMEYAR